MRPFAINPFNVPGRVRLTHGEIILQSPRPPKPKLVLKSFGEDVPNLGTPPPPVNLKAPKLTNVVPHTGVIPPGGPWTMNPYWLGETIFVVASGPSIKNVNFDLLKGRKIICVNCSFEVVKHPTMIFFGDGRLFNEHKVAMLETGAHIVTCSGLVKAKRALRVNRLKPVSAATGFAENRDAVASQRTSLQGAMNLAAHLCSNEKVKGRIVLIGADMQRDPATGASHGHKAHKWPVRPGNVVWDEQLAHLKWIVGPLKRRGIEVINTSMVSRIPWWPKMTLEEYLKKEAGK